MNGTCIGGELNSEADDVVVVGPDGPNADDTTGTRCVEDHSIARVETVVTGHHDDVAGEGVLDVNRLAACALPAGLVRRLGRARTLIEGLGLAVATPDEARSMLGLKGSGSVNF